MRSFQPANALLSIEIDYEAASAASSSVPPIFFWMHKNNSVSAFSDFPHHAKKPVGVQWINTTHADQSLIQIMN